MIMNVNTQNKVTGIIKSIQTDNKGNILIELIQTFYGNVIEVNVFTDIAENKNYTRYACRNKFNGKSARIGNRNEFYKRLTVGNEVSFNVNMRLERINGTANMYGYVLAINDATKIE